jgi:hypothetical protein
MHKKFIKQAEAGASFGGGTEVSMNPFLHAFPEWFADLAFEDFSRAAFWKLFAKVNLLGNFEAREMIAAVSDEFLVGCGGFRFENDDGHGHFTPAFIGSRHHGGFQNGWMRKKGVFDFD